MPPQIDVASAGLAEVVGFASDRWEAPSLSRRGPSVQAGIKAAGMSSDHPGSAPASVAMYRSVVAIERIRT